MKILKIKNQKKLQINKCIINMESDGEIKEIDIKNYTCIVSMT